MQEGSILYEKKKHMLSFLALRGHVILVSDSFPWGEGTWALMTGIEGMWKKCCGTILLLIDRTIKEELQSAYIICNEHLPRLAEAVGAVHVIKLSEWPDKQEVGCKKV